jgi:uncharacterized protein (DUF2384 family)
MDKSRLIQSYGDLIPDNVSERVKYRIWLMIKAADEVFNNRASSARFWMLEPAWGLGGKTPIEHVYTDEGADEVLNLLWGMEHGDVI